MRTLFLLLSLVAHTLAAANFPAAISAEQPMSDPVFTAPAGNQQTLAVASDGTIGFAVWLDTRRGNTDLYGSRIDVNGVSLDPRGILIDTNTTGGSVIFNGTDFVVASERGSEKTFTFVTTDGAIVDRKTMTLLYMQVAATMGSGPDARILFVGFGMGTIVDSHANIVMANVQLAMPASQSFAAAAAGANEFLILHTNLVPGRHLFADRFDRDGKLLGTVDSGVDLNVIGSTVALAGGSDGYLLVGRGPYEREVLAAHLDHNGVLTGFRSFAAYDATQRVPGNPNARPSVLRDGDHYEVAWTISDASGEAHTWRATEPAAGIGQGTPSRILDWAGMGYGTAIAKIGSQPVVVTDALRSGLSTSIDPLVTANGSASLVLSSTATLQSAPLVAASSNAYAVLWNEFGPDGSAHLYLRRSGAAAVEVTSSANGRAIPARVAAAGEKYVVAWATSSTLSGSGNYVVRRMSAATGQWLDGEPVPLATAFEIELASNNDGVMAAYTVSCPSQSRCLRTRPIAMDDGAPLRSAEAIPTSSSAFELSLARDGHDYLIAFNDNVCIFPCDAVAASRLLALRVRADGKALDANPLDLTGGFSYLHNPSAAWTGTSYAVTWDAGTIVGRRITSSGVADAVRAIAPRPSHLIWHRLVRSGSNLLLLFTEQNAEGSSTSGMVIDPQTLTANGDATLLATNQPQYPKLSAVTLPNGFVLAYERVEPAAGNVPRVFNKVYGEAARRRAARQ
ncbi:MAG: hypothetical protein QOE82_3007 [Thermoanaerobaculia bacterium]|nr:hypothetical protein [Thermoanaerobaculia bacterium]